MQSARVTALGMLVVVVLAAAPRAFAHAGLDELDARSAAETAAHPERADVHLDRARVLQMRGDWDGALAALEEAVARGADADVVGATRGAVFLDAGFPRMAKIEIDRVLARRPAAYDLFATRARACLALGDAEGAAHDLGVVVAKGTRPTPELVVARRDALLSLGRKAEALAALDEGMARVGRVVSLVLPAVDLEVALGRHDAALARLDALAAASPPNALWMARRGEILDAAGRHAEARAEWARAVALIDRRPAERRGRPLDDLKRRLETMLASADRTGGNR